MNCFNCDGTYQKKHGEYFFDDPYVGKIIIHDVDYFECPNCHDQQLPAKTAKLIGNKRKDLLQQYLQAQPIKDFFSSAETAKILDITRQALHKHKRINNGFIYYTEFNSNKVYLKKSVYLYKKNGDGRFLIKDLPTQPIASWISSYFKLTDIYTLTTTTFEASLEKIINANLFARPQMNRAAYVSNIYSITANKETNEDIIIDYLKQKEEQDVDNSNNHFLYVPTQEQLL